MDSMSNQERGWENLGSPCGESDAQPNLTQREWEVARLVAQGLSNDEIAERLSISSTTVKNHLMQAYQKLDVHNRADLVLWYLRRRSGKANSRK